jgi:alkylation response protein AidB-like acyl-CoA dehydrogenase
MSDLLEEHRELLGLVRRFADDEVAPQADRYERERTFPRPLFDQLAHLDLTGLPFGAGVGGSELPYRVYLMVVEELSRAFAAFGMGLSVHTLATWAIDTYGTPEQRERFVPDLVAGRVLGAYALSEPGSGSDAGAMTTRAVPEGGTYRLNGVKAWVSHAGVADRYLVMARTSDEGSRGVSAFVVDADQPGMTVADPEHKIAMSASPTAQLIFEDAVVPADRLIGDQEGQGMRVALSSLDGGRLGIEACGVGGAQAALDRAVEYAGQREQFGRTIDGFQGVGFLLADMAARTEAARALYRSAAAARDAGEQISKLAAMSKLVATDAAMQTTTDAVQVFGGYGVTRDFPVERYLREAKILQIVEGTNQIQRLVIARALTGRTAR